MRRRVKIKAIIVDYDDTIADFTGYLCRLHNGLHNTLWSPSDFTSYNFSDTPGGEALYETFKEYEKHGIYAALKLLPDSRNALRYAKMIGYHIIIMTARKEQFEKQTRMNIIYNNFPYDEIYFVPGEDKAKKVRELSKTYNIQLFADDKASTVREVSDRCKVKNCCIINKPHNSMEEFEEDVIRCNTLFDAVKHLKEIK